MPFQGQGWSSEILRQSLTLEHRQTCRTAGSHVEFQCRCDLADLQIVMRFLDERVLVVPQTLGVALREILDRQAFSSGSTSVAVNVRGVG
ncbi:hypothetical protein BH11PLA2_BH11PLA2_52380 [soil metagenome]